MTTATNRRSVIRLTKRDIQELYEVRLQLETLVVEQAARNTCPLYREQLNTTVAAMERAFSDHDQAAFPRTDVDLHRTIWAQDGARIVAALEARTCMPFPESAVAAFIGDDVSHSGGPEHPMGLRASYDLDVKRATLVHELGHRHLWQLAERHDDVDGHKTL